MTAETFTRICSCNNDPACKSTPDPTVIDETDTRLVPYIMKIICQKIFNDERHNDVYINRML